MAVLGREAHVAVGDDHIVGVERQVLIDPKSGLAAEVENVTVAVDMGDGNIAVARQQRVRGIQTGYGSVSSSENGKTSRLAAASWVAVGQAHTGAMPVN